MSRPTYNPVGGGSPDAGRSPFETPDPYTSPDPNNVYSHLSGNMPDSAYLSPQANERSALIRNDSDILYPPPGRRDSDYLPAPSILSHSSTMDSLPPTPGGTPGLRNSWGSGAALSGLDTAFAEVSHCICRSRLHAHHVAGITATTGFISPRPIIPRLEPSHARRASRQ